MGDVGTAGSSIQMQPLACGYSFSLTIPWYLSQELGYLALALFPKSYWGQDLHPASSNSLLH